MEALEEMHRRLMRLEHVEAIRRLKARYLNACDSKDTEALRACFAPGPIEIDYGHVGQFADRDAFVALFEAVGNLPNILDMHHGANPEIELLDDDRATGTWSFDYRNINTEAQTVTLVSGMYDDRYTLGTNGWQIVATRVTYVSALHLTYEQAGIVDVFTGKSVAGVVNYDG